MITIDDPDLPGLKALGCEQLSEMAGGDPVTVLRMRYRENRRAILHVAAQRAGHEAPNEGVVWLFAGSKGRRVARRNKAARFHSESGAVYERFPCDHRLPEIAQFLACWPGVAGALAGGPGQGAPELLRYRPGLSCTFRCKRADGARIFVKIIGKEDIAAQAQVNRQVRRALQDRQLGIAPCIGIAPDLRAIAYGAAPGRPLDALLPETSAKQALDRSLVALRDLHRSGLALQRRKDAVALMQAAENAHRMIAVMAPGAVGLSRELLRRLENAQADQPMRPIHGDMKLEHLFLDGPRVTMIDTESMALGPADYDLAMLHGRIVMAAQEGTVPEAIVRHSAECIRSVAGNGFAWCLRVVALRLAKFHAQRPGLDSDEKAQSILRAFL